MRFTDGLLAGNLKSDGSSELYSNRCRTPTRDAWMVKHSLYWRDVNGRDVNGDNLSPGSESQRVFVFWLVWGGPETSV